MDGQRVTTRLGRDQGRGPCRGGRWVARKVRKKVCVGVEAKGGAAECVCPGGCEPGRGQGEVRDGVKEVLYACMMG